MKLIRIALLLILCFTFTVNAQNYVAESIGFNPPHSYTQVGTGLFVDDMYSSVISLGTDFDFEFYGNVYSNAVIGTNGVISFDLDNANNFCPWSFDNNIPDMAFPVLNAILGVYHDMDVSAGSGIGEVNYANYGTEPNRRFVVNFYKNPQFSGACNDLESTIQVVLYETTNNIDVYIQEKPSCITWNDGNAVLGIINETGATALAAPGRNTSDSPWEAYNEAWRFSFFTGTEVEAYNATYTVCDSGGGGFEIFDLNLIIADVIGNQSNVTASFHSTFLDANNDVNPLISPYENTANPEIIYARVEDSGGLYATSEVTLQVISCIDDDNDGVDTAQEDLNGDGNVENDDTDNDGIPNYLDEDDDNDNVDTILEITGIGAGATGATYIFIDTDGDTIENYIDNDDDGDGVLSHHEDHNHNGTPVDDDINANSIPDFLDDEVVVISLGTAENELIDLAFYPNPATDVVTMSSTQFSSEIGIVVFNINGQQLVSETRTPQNDSVSLDVSGLESGLYFVQIASEGNSVTKKLIKK